MDKAKWKKRLAKTMLVGMGTAGIIGGWGAWTVYSVAQHLPVISSLTATQANQATTIVSSDGILLAALRTRDQRPIRLDAMAPLLVSATVATEDSRFYDHSGVDGRGILRALFANLRSGNGRGQGGSTLTQQLVRNLTLSREKTYRRKIAEMLLARRIEEQFSKNDILEAYLNTVYYGSGNYGVEAASRSYFGKSAKDLTLGEATLLAGIPQRPSAFTPTTHLRAALERRQDVLARLAATGQITPEQKIRAEAERPHILRPNVEGLKSWKAPYLVADVIAKLREQYGQEFLYSGATIETTINWQMQQQAEQTLREAVQNGAKSGANPNTGALVSLDPHTGYVRALVGGPDFLRDQFDAVTRGIRQPGSAFKPLLYATAFDAGLCSLVSTYKDAPLTYPSGGKDYVVHNFDSGYRGEVTVLDALRHSLNTVAVKIGEDVGPANVVTCAEKLGIHTPLEPTLPLALGASGVHPLDLCSAYTAFANGGDRYEPALISKITSARGKIVWQDDPATRLIPHFLKTRTLDQINVALREVVTNGTAQTANVIPDAHGKTGTTNSHRDAWFVGYTGELATAIWVAHSRKETHVENGLATTVTLYAPMEGATGGRLCAPMWAKFMQAALPVQQKVNQSRGIAARIVTAPTTEVLVADLRADAKRLAAEKRVKQMAEAGASAEPGAVIPDNYEPAENGSAPITVTAPNDAEEKTTETTGNTEDTGNAEKGEGKREPQDKP